MYNKQTFLMKSPILKLQQLIKSQIESFTVKCDDIASKNYFTNVYGLGRSLLAMGTMLTFIFNDSFMLFPDHLFNKTNFGHFLQDINLFFLLGYENIWISKLISIAILLVVISGFYPRITGVLHWWVSFSFFTSGIILDGGDQITSVLTLLLIPITLLDGRKNHWQVNSINNRYKNFTAYIVFIIVELQVAILYLQASIEKPYKVQEWVDGTAVYYWLNHNVFGAPDAFLLWFNPILDNPIFLSFLTWGAIIFELSLFGAFFMTRNRRVKFLKFAIAFHFSIIIFHGLPSFFFAMAGALILYLVPKDYALKFSKKDSKIESESQYLLNLKS